LNTPYTYIILIAILALSIAIFQYIYNAKKRTKKQYVFALLRFLTLFLLGFLLLNPKFNQKTQRLVKPNLVVAIDNSNSIKKLHQHKNATHFLKALQSSALSDKFNIEYYRFGKQLNPLDSLSFTATQTNISNVFSSLKEVYQSTTSPTIIVTDGNQTFGEDYVVSSLTYKQPIYPVVLGDSILKTDLKINHIQHNKYAFLNNEFPVEITIDYTGQSSVNQTLTIYNKKRKIFSKKLHFSIDNKTQVINTTLKANRVGKQYYTVKISTLPTEENTVNNIRNFSVSVIDERTKVLLISDILHPDLGAFKKAIESNKQRKVTVVKPTDSFDINNYQMVIVYQPNPTFKSVYAILKQLQKNHLTVTGLHTDWAFLNSVSTQFKRSVINQEQEYLARANTGFNLFQYNELDVNSYPPLKDLYGDLELKNSANTLLYQQIGNVNTQAPLLTFFEEGSRREALLIGEGIWKWRAKSFMNTKSFENFDAFIGKTVQFLASNTKKQRLVVDAKDEFYLGETRIDAQFFDKNYQFDGNKQLRCKLINAQTKTIQNYDFFNKNNGYTLNLSALKAGKYQYIVSVSGTKIMKKGSFEVLDFNIEAQFLNADVTKLRQLATNATNKLYFSADYKTLFEALNTNEQYKTVQKEEITQQPLINWKYLLGIILLLLAIEWLMRKYNGLL